MLRLFINEKLKITTAVLHNSKFDAFNTVSKKLGLKSLPNWSEQHMPDYFDLDSLYGMTSHDLRVVNKALEMDKLLMCDKYAGSVSYDERDTYDTAVGEKLAVEKAMGNRSKGYRKAMVRWQKAMIKKIMNMCPETFEEALHSVRPCHCKK